MAEVRIQPESDNSGIATGFILGVIAGAAAVVLMGPENRKQLGGKARSKFDELTAGKTVDEVMDSVRQGVRGVMDDIDEARQLSTAEYDRTKTDVLEGRRPAKR